MILSRFFIYIYILTLNIITVYIYIYCMCRGAYTLPCGTPDFHCTWHMGETSEGFTYSFAPEVSSMSANIS